MYGLAVTDDDRGHWAFRPTERPPVPAPQRMADWIRNPIDAFVLAKLQATGLEPSPAAEDIPWLRRVTFDLVGLPPTPEEVAEFVADNSPQARERVVDRLLADPGYGIRWGRHWLDVVRFADTNGYERDGAKPHAWRYRDYVIDSLNADKPFDRFLTEQLAGDELEDADAESMIATTLLRLGTWDDEPADPEVDRYDQLDDVLGTVSATFLGLTLRCARCHNHKFEPLSQIDYARMLAFFEPLKRPQNGRTDLDLPVGTRQELADAEAAQARHEAVVKTLEAQIHALDDRVRDRFLQSGPSQISAEALAAHRTPEANRNDAQKKLVKETQKQLNEEAAKTRTAGELKQREAFQAALTALQAAAPAPLPRAYIWHEPAGQLPVTQVFRRGNPTTPAGTVAAGFPEVLGTAATELLSPDASAKSSRRRLSLARWMTDPKNPLVARVIVNRLWQGHFGNGLVGTENDFGVMGFTPSHPELLDWLASELRSPSIPSSEKGTVAVPWSLKHIHKLIVLSSTYAQSSRFRESAARVDVDNALLWRFPYRRLTAEAVRDTVLAVNGQLNPQRGGPGIYPKIAQAVLDGQSMPGNGWGTFDEGQAARRAIYIFVKRSLLVPEIELLDFADTNTSCEQRPVSTIPTQALTLLNGDFLNQQATHFAARLIKDSGNDRAAQIDRAYRLAVSRAPTADEAAAALAFLDRQTQQSADEPPVEGRPPRDPARTALEALCLVLYNLNEFAYVD
ncbi:MAG TPA: DUF1549 and DUF1553 domain-containing protein [Planctomycetaceae bacterium]|nr:DUF1549 and DUF1553 domain-containing protein [Planctomycetaceae bacterium]